MPEMGGAMMKRTIWTGASAMAVPAPTLEIASVKPLSTADIASHCQAYVNDSNSAEAKICMSYVQGFFVSDQQLTRQGVYRPLREAYPCCEAD